MAWPKWLVEGGDEPAKEASVATPLKPVPGVPQQQQYVQPVSYTPAFSAVGLDQSQHERWNKFFIDLLAAKGDPKYRQFMGMVDSMGNAIPANVKYPSVFGGLRTMGHTKQALLDAANATADVLNKDADTFKAQMDQRKQREVTDVQETIKKKQEQMLLLQQEIQQLNDAANAADQKTNMSMLGYSTYFKQAQTKIGEDIASITNFIQE